MGNSIPVCCSHAVSVLVDQNLPVVPALKITDDDCLQLKSSLSTESPRRMSLWSFQGTQEAVIQEKDGGISTAFDAKTEDPLSPIPEACEVTVADISGTREREKPLDASDDRQLTTASLLTLDSAASAATACSAKADCRKDGIQKKAKEKRRGDQNHKQAKRETEKKRKADEERKKSEQKKENDLKHAAARKKKEEARKRAEKEQLQEKAKIIKPMLATAGKYLAEFIEEGNAKMIRDLIEFGANPDEPDDNGLVPLKAACYSNRVECVQALLEMKANVNLKGRSVAGHISTALHIACKNGCEENIRALLAAGADTSAKNGHDQLPSQIAKMNNRTNAVRILKMHMEKNAPGRTS